MSGVRDGHGTQTWSDGATYIGEFKVDKRHGFGRLKAIDGLVYEGDWVGN